MDPYTEFCDKNMWNSYPLTDSSGARDTTDSFIIPTDLITDIYLCAPAISGLDITKFYVSNILIRRYRIDIEISYDDPGLTRPLGVFSNIEVEAELQSCYIFTPYSNNAVVGVLAPLYYMTGQIVIGNAREAAKSIGSWSFEPTDPGHQTYILGTRVGVGTLSMQYVVINDRVFSGQVRLREGANVRLDVDTEVIGGVTTSVITVNATLTAGSPDINLASDQDVIDALASMFGPPLQTINGIRPDASRNFALEAADCVTVTPLPAGVALGNPCATPCCDENDNVNTLMDSVSGLNLRYAQLQAMLTATADAINRVQQKLLVLGAEV